MKEPEKAASPQVTDIKGFAKAIDTSERTAWALVNKREIPHIRIGRSVKIPLSAIDEFIKKRTIKAV